MNAERLLAHYHEIADAPDAVARLRRFILNLAVRGKIVPQDAGDEPASELLKRVAKEKARLVIEGKLKKAGQVETLSSSDHDIPVPHGWVITNLQSICNSVTDGDHLPPPKAEIGIPFLVIGNVRNQHIDFVGSRFVPLKYYEALDPIRRPQRGDLLYTLVGSYGIPVIVRDDKPFCIQRHIGILRPSALIDVNFLARAMESRLAFDQATACATGIAQKTVPLTGLRKLFLPLPPLAEQRRIVAKVDELMDLCDRLEAARASREVVRDRLATASLARLNAPASPTFQADARFALEALPALTARPNQIKQLRQTILNLAVRGRLWSAGSGELKGIGTFRSLQNGYAFKSQWFKKEGIKLLRNANVGHGYLRWDDTVYLAHDQATEYERFALRESDIVLTLDRPFIVTGTKVARVNAGDLPSLLLQRVGRFVETAPGLSDDYLFLWINSPHFNEQIDPGRSNGVPHISTKQVEAAEIFVPPLAEQRRIVAKVDELMALCERLEASLATAADTRRGLLDALLADALAPVDRRELEAAE